MIAAAPRSSESPEPQPTMDSSLRRDGRGKPAGSTVTPAPFTDEGSAPTREAHRRPAVAQADERGRDHWTADVLASTRQTVLA